MNQRESFPSELLSWWGIPVILTLLALRILVYFDSMIQLP